MACKQAMAHPAASRAPSGRLGRVLPHCLRIIKFEFAGPVCNTNPTGTQEFRPGSSPESAGDRLDAAKDRG